MDTRLMALRPVEGNPFQKSTGKLTSVDYDPFAQAGSAPTVAMSRSNPLVRGINDLVNKAGTGITRGIAGMVGMPGYIANLVGPGFEMQNRAARGENVMAEEPYGADYSMGLPTYNSATKKIFQDWGVPEVNAESMPGRIAQGFLSAVLPGMGGKTAAISGMAGAGMSAVDEFAPGNKYAQLAAALAAPVLTHGAMSIKRPTNVILREAMEGLSPENIEAAIALQSAGKRIGVPLTPGQASDNPELLGLERLTEQSRAGGGLRSMANSRAKQVQSALNPIIQTLGDTSRPRMNVIKAKQAATDAVNDVTGARTRAVDPFYQKASTQGFLSSSMKPIFKAIDAKLAAVGESSDIGKQLRSYRSKIDDAIEGHRANVGPLDAIYKETRDRANPKIVDPANPNALNSEMVGVLGPINRSLGNLLAEKNTSLAKGREIYKNMTPAVDDILNSATRSMSKASKYKTQKSILTDPETMREVDINRVAREMNAKDKNAFRNWTATYLENEMNAAIKTGRGNQAPYVGGKFVDIMRNPQQRKNIQAMFNNIPNGAERFRAFNTAIDVIDATSKRIQFGSPTQSAGEAASRLKRFPIPFTEHGVLRWINDVTERGRYSSNVEEFAKIFTSDDGMEIIKELARTRPNSDRAKLLTGAVLGTSLSLQQNQQRKRKYDDIAKQMFGQ